MNHDSGTKVTRDFSAAVFGAQYRLEICEVLHAGSVITATELAESLSPPPSKSCIKMEIDRLVTAGLLVRKMRDRGSRLSPLEVQESPIWDAARTIVQDLREKRSKEDLGVEPTGRPRS